MSETLRLLPPDPLPVVAANIPCDSGEDGLRECGICGDYIAQGIEVHEVCLNRLRAVEAAARRHGT